MENDTRACKYSMKGRVVLRRIGEDVLLVPVSGPASTGGGRVFPVNETAEVIWKGLVNGETVSQIAEDLASQYDLALPSALADAEECTEAFVSESLLERVS